MHRITRQRYAEPFAEALRRLPAGIARRVAFVDLLTGDPVFAGLHAVEDASAFGYADGTSYYYRVTAHVVYPGWQSRPRNQRRTTIVYPNIDEDACAWGPRYPVFVFVHELGHVLHEQVGFQVAPEPVAGYARTNACEAFAEAFTLHVAPDLCREIYGEGHYREDVLAQDAATLALFEELAR
jgi:hypothetical protein